MTRRFCTTPSAIPTVDVMHSDTELGAGEIGSNFGDIVPGGGG